MNLINMINKIENLGQHCRIECGLCGFRETFEVAKERLAAGLAWCQVPFTGKYICWSCNQKIVE